MLTNLSIRDLAVVDDITITFEKGMTSLTGETGAGKSMLVDAMSLVLGDRADSNMIRQGSERAEIAASFDSQNNPVLQQWLVEQELDDDNQCHLRRTITKEGRSRAYINGRAVPLSQLRAISERTIDIHGQHEHQSLVRSETQRQLLDTVAKTQPLLTELTDHYQQWQSLQQQLNQLEQTAQDQAARRELLQYQVNELAPLNLSEEYLQQLVQEQHQLAHASQLIATAESALHQLADQEQGAAYTTISHVLGELEQHQEVEPRFNNLIEVLNSTVIQLDEAASDLRHYLDSTDVDPQRLQQVETELGVLHTQARKHHIEIEQLPAHFEQLQQELNALANIETHTEQLQQQLNQQQQICLTLCQQITEQRQLTATPLAEQITQSIQQLAIPTGQIEIIVSPMANNHFNETGADQVQILVKTNPGQAAGELGKVASGGELARISLAIQVVTAGSRSVPTLVFDEVDVGIGGGIAEIVGNHLRKLAISQQVICITHLPQVAAQAHQQLQVSKKNLDNSTHIEITTLNKKQRVEEIARMLGGVTLTEKTRLHAEEMLSQSQS
ncbi:MAG: DNA repair protein RecN [Gammaproteobacteria bacterium]|nr:MAG: DNA repair protein RecN [Gammaproteobacteria bacterium]